MGVDINMAIFWWQQLTITTHLCIKISFYPPFFWLVKSHISWNPLFFWLTPSFRCWSTHFVRLKPSFCLVKWWISLIAGDCWATTQARRLRVCSSCRGYAAARVAACEVWGMWAILWEWNGDCLWDLMNLDGGQEWFYWISIWCFNGNTYNSRGIQPLSVRREMVILPGV